MAVSRRADVWTTIATCSPDDAQHVSDARLIQDPESATQRSTPHRVRDTVAPPPTQYFALTTLDPPNRGFRDARLGRNCSA